MRVPSSREAEGYMYSYHLDSYHTAWPMAWACQRRETISDADSARGRNIEEVMSNACLIQKLQRASVVDLTPINRESK